MSAYNWIEIERYCPACKNISSIKCQTHFFSDYDGDSAGRFHDYTYHLKEKIRWWSKSDHRYFGWRSSNSTSKEEGLLNTECCYGECDSCKTDLFVIIEFGECYPDKVLNVGLENEWPCDYLK